MGDPGARATFEAAHEALVEASTQSDEFEFARARNRFHRTMARISANPELDRMLANLQGHLVRNRPVMRPEERAESYRRIGAAILACDGEGASAARAATCAA